MRLKLVALIMGLALGGAIAACSKPSSNQQSSNTPAQNSNQSASANTNRNAAGPVSDDEVIAQVKAAFPDAQSVTPQNKELTSEQVASIEKDSGATLAGKDFRSFAAHDGSHKQLGAATLTSVQGAGNVQLLVIYTSDGKIKKVAPVRGNGDVASAAFLDQFAGKDHTAAFHVGDDIKYDGSDKPAAEAVAHAIKRDLLAMHALYGKEHGH